MDSRKSDRISYRTPRHLLSFAILLLEVLFEIQPVESGIRRVPLTIYFRRRQNGYVTQLVQLVKPEHVSDTLMMRTTLKELKEKTFKVH